MDEDVDINNYNCVYQGSMPPAGQVIDSLNTNCEKFNIDRPDDFKGYSLSVSDVIGIRNKRQSA